MYLRYKATWPGTDFLIHYFSVAFIFTWFLTLQKVQSVDPHNCRAFSTCISSSCLSRLSEISEWLLSKRVLTTLSLYSIGWCEMKFKYWSVCVSFLYICNFTSHSSFQIINTSRNELTFRFHLIRELDVTRLIQIVQELCQFNHRCFLYYV